MDLQTLRQEIYKAGFSSDVLIEINKILDPAIEKGYLFDDEQEKLLKILDFDIQFDQAKSDALNKMQSVLKNGLEKMDQEVEKAQMDLDDQKNPSPANPQ